MTHDLHATLRFLNRQPASPYLRLGNSTIPNTVTSLPLTYIDAQQARMVSQPVQRASQPARNDKVGSSRPADLSSAAILFWKLEAVNRGPNLFETRASLPSGQAGTTGLFMHCLTGCRSWTVAPQWASNPMFGGT